MKPKSKIISKRKRGGLKRPPVRLRTGKKQARNEPFKSKSYIRLENRIRSQNKEIKKQDSQLKDGIDRERDSDQIIEDQREELLHVTRVGKLAEFVSSLAHEISQPLTAILSYAQAAQRIYAGREPELQEILQHIINDNHRATEVIRRLRLLLRKTKPVLERLDINTLINNTVTLIMSHIIVRNKTIKFDLAHDLPHIHGDQIQLQQVLLNLISNSLEAMEGDDKSRELKIRSTRSGRNEVKVEVIDTGTGISPEHKKKLFVHFFTSKPDGLGMGLSISRSIIEAHSGKINFKNNTNRGANFYFTLPVDAKLGT